MMNVESRKLWISENYEVTERQQTIIKILKRTPNATKGVIIKALSDEHDIITLYQLERELGVLQGKRLLDSKLNVININTLDDLVVIPNEQEHDEDKKRLSHGFYDGTNDIQQSRKWLRAKLNDKGASIFKLNPTGKLALIQLGNNKGYLTKDMITLRKFPDTKEFFEQSLSDLKEYVSSKKYSKEWKMTVTLLTDYICRAKGFYEYCYEDDEGHFREQPSTFEDYGLEHGHYDEPSTMELLEEWGIYADKESTDPCIPYFSDIYAVIVGVLKQAIDKEISYEDADIMVVDSIDSLSFRIVEYLCNLLRNIESNSQRQKNCNLIEAWEKLELFAPKNTSVIFVGLWCIYWQIYYKEL